MFKYAVNNDFFMLINHGAKRTGKTILNNDLFLSELRRVKKIANEENISLPQYILAGADLGALQRNVLNELTNKYGLEFKFDKHNRFILFGVQVCCFGHSKINDMSRIRGMTAYGAYINEGSMANQEVFNEIKSRCSGTGARILIDTNPDNPEHWLKVDYIDKAQNNPMIVEFNWQLDDNTFLSKRYKDSIIAATPSGMFTDRDIYGKWVSAQGAVYKDFNRNIHYISIDKVPFNDIESYFVGVDFGWEHPGVFTLFGVTKNRNYYLIKEYSDKYRSIEEWIEIAHQIIKQYGDIYFYCDSARPDHIKAMQIANILAVKARKDVLAGIMEVASLFKQNMLYVVYDENSLFKKEIYSYVWKENTSEPIKLNDDCMDSMRYGIYSHIYFGR